MPEPRVPMEFLPVVNFPCFAIFTSLFQKGTVKLCFARKQERSEGKVWKEK
jgi:hypothetical protein